MKIEITVPAAGESVSEGDIVKWFKQSGDIVEMDEALLELETEKASLEIAAEAAGKLTILVDAGETVQVGQTVGYIDTNASMTAQKPVEEEANKVETDDNKGESEDNGETDTDIVDDTTIPSPAARKLMAERNLSSNDIRGSGKGGRITKSDVVNFIEERDKQDAISPRKHRFVSYYASDTPVTSPDETITMMRKPAKSKPADTGAQSEQRSDRKSMEKLIEKINKASIPASQTNDDTSPDRSTRTEKLSRIRKTISQRLVNAQQSAALLTTFTEVDMSEIMSIRSKYKEQFKDSHKVGLGFMSFFTRASCQTLAQFPSVNAQMDDESITYFNYCDLGIAVSTPKGLVVPVIRNAESMSMFEIEKTILELASRGRNGQLTMSELSGGTFTITNGGVFGSMLSTPIVNSPQSAILGMHNIVERAVVVGGDIVIRPMMYLALTYDHRLIDGSDAVQFLVKIKELCEDPVRMMLEI